MPSVFANIGSQCMWANRRGGNWCIETALIKKCSKRLIFVLNRNGPIAIGVKQNFAKTTGANYGDFNVVTRPPMFFC